MYFLETKKVIKQYATGNTALDGVSIQVPKGIIFGLLGPNGAGKTTLIRIINRIMAPDSGEVMFDNRKSLPDDVYRIGYLPEERGLYRKMKAGEQAVYLARLKGLSAGEASKRLHALFQKLDIASWWNKRLEELSKGMQQKVQFITTIAHNPDLLIFDEPFSGFDPLNTELLKNEIRSLKADGKTIIFSTHNMASVEELCDEIALIDHAKVVLSGNIADIRRKYRCNVFTVRTDNESLAVDDSFCEVVSRTKDHNLYCFTVKKTSDTSNSEFITRIAASNEIISFEEKAPSMNEIFINTINTTTYEYPKL
ncbi:MAG: ATP-binding cassette domain-containing protein [Dysgonamonadaceae bacterium]|jgi:ABC-2 type transport system ATP-binding protein|nr:ATP-binding cassette domain-containing protein [Dysgonamonadaceae bacterium]